MDFSPETVMEKLPNNTRDALRKPMPEEAISEHPTKKFLSTIKAIYIVERLNDIFGIGGWTAEHEIVSDAEDYVTVAGRIKIGEPLNFATPVQYGGHKKTGKNTEPADGYKSAVTDMISKCASFLEIGIDVFKGKTNASPPPKQRGNTASKKSDVRVMTQKQKEAIFKSGKAAGLKSDDEVVEIVRWKAEQLGIDPKSPKLPSYFIGKDDDGNWKFEKVIDDYMASPEYAAKHTQENESLPDEGDDFPF